MDPAVVLKPAKVTIWNRNFICAVLANLFLCVAHFSVNTLVATYATFLGAAPVIMGLLTGMFFAVALAIRPVSGPMITKIDKRKLMIFIYALGGVVNIGYALFHSIPAFVVFRFLNGVQYSFVGSLIMTVAADSLPKEKMASGIGIFGIGGAIGTAFGPFIGTSLLNFGIKTLNNEDFGFTLVFLFAAVVLSLAVIPSVMLRPDAKTKEDVASTGVWYKNIITVYAVPVTVVMFFVIMSYALYNSYIVNFADEQGIGNVSVFYLVMAGTLIFSRPLSGLLTDKLGVAKVILPGMALFAVSFLIVGFSKTLGMALVGAVVAAIGVGATQPPLQAMCIQTEVPLKRSVASNTIYVGMDVGLFLGPLLGSVVYKHTSFAFMFKSAIVPVVLAFVSFIIILPMYNKRVRALEAAEKEK
ncbi:Predicted arabinose efflux permease, MFS family [Sporobacter termitidis DSM 10068]|uniref:Predicted arabinose efflux permease, MFS family n=1 Tax=Sporobacter termitidis DSM 10068 TaxID=1123282 RepID=A0A1M5X6D6_9FIRM|nr:MFS transporter [Sporobacter termitidis]SHH95138.1 Predicted arabinose efflux permease, MFS family [Sporobacter termitidis DSM 10068]